MRRINLQENILYEDTQILVCRKKAGFPVQSARLGSLDMESLLKNYLAEKHPGKVPYLGVVHRLDQPVEGILVFAKNQAAAGKLSRQMQNGTMKKWYLAVVEGVPEEKKGTLTDVLKKDGKTNCSAVVAKGTPGGKEARLFYEVLEEREGRSLLRVILDTGRHHQIRVQLAHAGMPIVGDSKYGSGGTGQGALALCAYHLGFRDLKSGREVFWQVCPEGEAFADFSRKLPDGREDKCVWHGNTESEK